MPQCKALTNHMCSTVTGSWRPCCRIENFKYVDASLVSFSEYKKSQFYQNIITMMETGWHPGCIKCKQEEEVEHGSLREEMNRKLSGNSNIIESLELSPSSKCNLACKMCSPSYSTTWQHIVKKNKLDIKITNNKPLSIDQVFAGVDISNLKAIKYLGGEKYVRGYSTDSDYNYLQNYKFYGYNLLSNSISLQGTIIDKEDYDGIELGLDGVLFADCGAVGRTARDISIRNAILGFGFGVKIFVSSVGFLGLYIGFNPKGQSFVHLRDSDN